MILYSSQHSLNEGNVSLLTCVGSLEFKAKLQVYPSGSQVIGDGVLLLEDGLDPGTAGFIADLEEV